MLNDETGHLNTPQFALALSLVGDGVFTFLLFLLVEREKGIRKGPVLNAFCYAVEKFHGYL